MAFKIDLETTLNELTAAIEKDPNFGPAPTVAAIAMLVGFIAGVCVERGLSFDQKTVIAMLSAGKKVDQVLSELALRAASSEPEDHNDLGYDS